MKIALLSEKYTPDIGGLAISTERFARLLSSVGYETRVFAPTLTLSPSEKRTLTHSGVSVTRFGAHKRVDDTLVDWFEFVVEEHKREPFNVLHAYFLAQAGFVATYAGKYLNIPSVVSMRGNDIDRAAFDPSKFSQVMYVLQNADAITTNANELARKAKAFVEGREVIVIPNGVDAEHFKPMKKNEELIKTLGLNHDPDGGLSNLPIVGFVGELREKKGIKTLLNAYAQINKQLQASLLIVGLVREGEDKKTFDEFVQTNPNLKIVVTGYISPNDLPAYYSLIDVLLHPSLHDGMPNALLEAMACGKPVIATPVGGISDVVKNGETGILIPVNDEEALTSAIFGLLSDATLRKNLGISARQTIIEKFSPQMELQANLNLYRKLGQTL